MYVWKLWREAWPRLAVCTALGIVWVVLIAWVFRGLLGRGGLSVDRVWSEASQVNPLVIGTAMLLAATAIVENTVGNEFVAGTAEFLFTRPRPRRDFVWAGWAFGMSLLVAATALVVGCEVSALYVVTGSFARWQPLATCVLLLPLLALVYGLGYLLTVVLRSGRNGAALTLVAIISHVILSMVAAWRWNATTPDWWFANLLSWQWHPTSPFPVVPVVGWTLVALLFPLLAQWRLERMEV